MIVAKQFFIINFFFLDMQMDSPDPISISTERYDNKIHYKNQFSKF